jgi:hypothetical protein
MDQEGSSHMWYQATACCSATSSSLLLKNDSLVNPRSCIFLTNELCQTTCVFLRTSINYNVCRDPYRSYQFHRINFIISVSTHHPAEPAKSSDVPAQLGLRRLWLSKLSGQAVSQSQAKAGAWLWLGRACSCDRAQ